MFWDKLKAIRELLGYSQADISEKTGIKQKDISLLEGGKKKFIPNEYIHFLYNERIDINSIYDDSRTISFRNSTFTPLANEEIDVTSISKVDNILHPKSKEILHPTLHATHSLGLPKVVTIGEDSNELISLVPVKASAGYLNGFADPEYIEKLPTLRMPNMGNGTHRAFEIKGHSMNPTLYNGSISIGRWIESLDDIRDRRIYIIVTKTDGIVVKRVLNRINEAGKLILISDNQNKREYPNIHLYPEDVLEIWYQRANLAFEFPEPDILYNRVNDLEAKMSILIEHFQKTSK